MRLTGILLALGTVLAPATLLAQSTLRVDGVLPKEEWRRVEEGVDRGLEWLASQQRPNGSFPAPNVGQPGVTSLCVMAYLSRGHRPGAGPYGDRLNRAIDFVLSQQQENGLLYGSSTAMPSTNWYQGSHTATYNHAISGLMLGEAYGMTDESRAKQLRPAIEKAVELARQIQRRPSPYPMDKYAWRYYKHHHMSEKGEADLSVTGWYIMFYRSAKNAEFDVPEEYVQDAISFVRCCYQPEKGVFYYGPYPDDRRTNRAMNGAGILCMAITGNHDPKIAEPAAKWLHEHPFTNYNEHLGTDRYHYSAYYCSQAMFMLGGEHWDRFYPLLSGALVNNQNSDGSWDPEISHDSFIGNSYTTALAVLSLTPPYQMLPIYQR